MSYAFVCVYKEKYTKILKFWRWWDCEWCLYFFSIFQGTDRLPVDLVLRYSRGQNQQTTAAGLHFFIHQLVIECLEWVLGTGNVAVNKTKSSASWSFPTRVCVPCGRSWRSVFSVELGDKGPGFWVGSAPLLTGSPWSDLWCFSFLWSVWDS